MKALHYSSYGDCEDVMKVGEVENATIEYSTDVLVKVHAASLNPADLKHAKGGLRFLVHRKLPILVGFDVSGVVEDVGSEVKSLKKGDEVFGMVKGLRTGTVAEYIAINEDFVVKKPSSISHEQAAACPLAATTAINCFEEAGLKPNEDNGGPRIAITAGAGGVGVFAIQIAKKVFNASYVVTTASPGEKTELVKRVGADEVVNYRETSLAGAFIGKPEEELFDVILDSTNEVKSLTAITKKNGHIVSIGHMMTSKMLAKWASYAANEGPSVSSLLKLVVSSPLGGIVDVFSGAWNTNRSRNYSAIITTTDKRIMEIIANAISQNELEIIIDSTFTFENAIDAVKRLNTGRAAGKVIIKLN